MTPRLSRSAFAPVCCALACLLGPGSAFADTVVLTSVDDNTIIEDPAGFWSAGAAQYFFAGKVGVNGGNTLRRGALRFDLSGIPAGSTITSVSLRMYCSAAGLTSAQAVALKRFTASWGEGGSVAFGGGGAFAQQNDTTWLHRFYPNTFWATPGGEFTSTVTVSRTVNGIGTYTWASTPQFVADVQDMVNNPSTNYGWCVQGNEGVNQSVKRFDSHESSVVSTRPQLTVEFTPPPANPSDLTGDGKVNAEDLAVLLSSWGTSGSADITGDGTVNGADLGVLLSSWTG
ncbi:MAG: hypothetical protein RLZZ238_492 [Planctomycetota bacterium]